MIVITLTSCPPKLRGDLSKWLCEINTGVYVGQLSARVREALWNRICENIGDGQATMVYSVSNEQHFEFRTHNTPWKIRDFDGIKLMMRPRQNTDTLEELSEGFSNASKRRMAGRYRNGGMNANREWAILDIETTGLNPENDEIIEMAVLVADVVKIKSKWNVLIKTNVLLPAEITKLTGITSEMLRMGDEEIVCALAHLSEIITGKTVVCYNKKFDIAFLENEFRKNGIACSIGRVTDVLSLARKRVVDIQNYKLGSLAEYFGISCEKRHRALADCEILYEVFLKLNEI